MEEFGAVGYWQQPGLRSGRACFPFRKQKQSVMLGQVVLRTGCGLQTQLLCGGGPDLPRGQGRPCRQGLCYLSALRRPRLWTNWVAVWHGLAGGSEPRKQQPGHKLFCCPGTGSGRAERMKPRAAPCARSPTPRPLPVCPGGRGGGDPARPLPVGEEGRAGAHVHQHAQRPLHPRGRVHLGRQGRQLLRVPAEAVDPGREAGHAVRPLLPPVPALLGPLWGRGSSAQPLCRPLSRVLSGVWVWLRGPSSLLARRW